MRGARPLFADRFSGAVVHLTTAAASRRKRLTTNVARLRHDETKTMKPGFPASKAPADAAGGFVFLRFRMHHGIAKTKCPRQRVTQAFWL
jgi:hypothetical protein